MAERSEETVETKPVLLRLRNRAYPEQFERLLSSSEASETPKPNRL